MGRGGARVCMNSDKTRSYTSQLSQHIIRGIILLTYFDMIYNMFSNFH